MPIPEPTAADARDVIAISQLAAAYSEAVSRFAVAEAVEVFAEDGVLRSPTTSDVIGRAAITELIGQTISGLDLLFQTVHTGLVHVTGDTATARFPITEWARRRKDGQTILFLGVYDDVAVRGPDGWRFAQRSLSPRALGKPDAFTGKVHDLAPHLVGR